MQQHFYHTDGGCSEETFVHYICKTWLFEKGCRFIVCDIEYEVKNIEVEKTLHTSFGDYRPDIIVTSTIGKIFYFEIRTTNKKTEHFIPKWDELGNDVVEVDTRYFINQKYNHTIPEFNLIYSNGKCYIKAYSHKDYQDTIARRKLEWKRQDKINYKIQWERLDWFWEALCDYKAENIDETAVIEYFSQLDYEDKVWCYQAIKNKTCIQLKDVFKENINQHFFDMLKSYEEKYSNIKIVANHVSPLIYMVNCRYEFQYLDYVLFEERSIKVRLGSGGILPLDTKSDIKSTLDSLSSYMKEIQNISLKKMFSISKLSYVKSITPVSHWAATNYNFSELPFRVTYEDYIHSKCIKEDIGVNEYESLSYVTKRRINREYLQHKENACAELEEELITYALKNNTDYQNVIKYLKDKCQKISGSALEFRVSDDYQKIVLLDGVDCLCEYHFEKYDFFDEICNKVKSIIETNIDQYTIFKSVLDKYVSMINNCANHQWHIEKVWKNNCNLFFYDTSGAELGSTYIDLMYKYRYWNCENIDEQIKQIFKYEMSELCDEYTFYKHHLVMRNYRVMEER